MVAVTRLTLVLPPTVEIDRVACPPAFSILWKASSKIVSSSPSINTDHFFEHCKENLEYFFE